MLNGKKMLQEKNEYIFYEEALFIETVDELSL